MSKCNPWCRDDCNCGAPIECDDDLGLDDPRTAHGDHTAAEVK